MTAEAGHVLAGCQCSCLMQRIPGGTFRCSSRDAGAVLPGVSVGLSPSRAFVPAADAWPGLLHLTLTPTLCHSRDLSWNMLGHSHFRSGSCWFLSWNPTLLLVAQTSAQRSVLPEGFSWPLSEGSPCPSDLSPAPQRIIHLLLLSDPICLLI